MSRLILSVFFSFLIAPLVSATEEATPKIPEAPAISEAIKTVTAFTLNDQHGKPHSISKATKMILFATGKSTNKLVVTTLKTKKPGYLGSKNVKYVADVSSMPSMIYNWFGLPKMRKYNFTVLLDRGPKESKELPFKKDHITMIYLKELAIQNVVFTKDVKEIQAALEAL